MTDQGYNLNDLLILIGQSTVELAYMRRRIAELEAALAPKDEVITAAPNGTVIEVPAKA